MKERKWFRFLVSMVIPIGFFIFLTTKVPIGLIWKTLRTVSFPWLSLAFGCYVMNIVFRTLRFHVLIRSVRVKYFDLFKVHCLYSFLNYFLPFRSGEFSYVYYGYKYLLLPPSEGISTLIISRVFDYLILSGLIILSMIRIRHYYPGFNRYFAPIIGIFLLICFLSAVILLCGRPIGSLLEKRRKGSNRIHRRFLKALSNVVERLESVKNMRTIFNVLVISVLVWVFIFFTFFAILQSLGVRTEFWVVIMIVLFTFFARLVQGPGNIGGHEAAWAGALVMVGFCRENAITAAMSSHVILILFPITLATFTVFFLKRPSQSRGDYGLKLGSKLFDKY